MGRARALFSFTQDIFHFVALAQATTAFFVVDEEISAIGLFDKAEALLLIEPFDHALDFFAGRRFAGAV